MLSPAEESPRIGWVEKLYRHSPLKREKFHRIQAFLPAEMNGLHLLDIGGDNGVISYKLRELGGEWSSLDLIEEAVTSIREVVHERVYQLQAGRIPLPDQSADVIVVVPGVTASIVRSPAPVLMMVMAVPIAKSVVASVGMLTVLVPELEVNTST